MREKAYRYISVYLVAFILIFTSSISGFSVRAEDKNDVQKDAEEVLVVEETETLSKIDGEISGNKPTPEIGFEENKKIEEDLEIESIQGSSNNKEESNSELTQGIELEELNGDVSLKTDNMLKNNLARSNNAGAFNVTGDIGWTYNSGVLTFNTSGDYTVTGDGNETSDRIVVADNFEGIITIDNVNINARNDGFSPVAVNNTAKLTIMLVGSNKLRADYNRAAIEFNNATVGSLTIDSDTDGSLEAIAGWNGSVVGGGSGYDGNNIIINGGSITAIVDFGAGIGGGYEGSANNIIINDGTIIVESNMGAGIGGGRSGSARNISINGGTITTKTTYGAGIGGGFEALAENIVINGGTIVSNSENGAGIGGGNGGSANNITINGGNITAISSILGAGIGGGAQGSAENIFINGGTIIVETFHGAGIGGGDYAPAKNIKITGGKITATSTEDGSGIGGGYASGGEKISITGGTIVAYSSRGNGIGGGLDGQSGDIIIDGGSIKASSIGSIPKNSNGDEVYLAKVDNQDGVNAIKVDGTNYNVSTNHDSDTSLYLYLTDDNHVATIEKGGNKYNIMTEWNGDHFTSLPFNAGAFYVSGGIAGTDWKYDRITETLSFRNDRVYKVTGDGIETRDKIVVHDNFEGTITIKDLNISADYSFRVESDAKLTIMLEGTNTLTSNWGNPGLEFTDATVGVLIIDSAKEGSLKAKGSLGSAGIGGEMRGSANNITINGGTITTIGGENGAGIGGGYGGSANNITINGGTIISIAEYGAGIGGGNDGSASNIIINGGNISSETKYGAGIGGGMNGSATNITVKDGTIIATSTGNGAGIGGGYNGNGDNITINGGTITTSGQDGEGIGGGMNAQSSDITIDGGSVKASSIGSTPKNSNGDDVYLAKIDDQEGASFIEIDNKNFKIIENHIGDTSFYLYLSGEDHTLNYIKDNKDYIRNVEWNDNDKKFSFVKLNPITTYLVAEKITSTTIIIKALANPDTYGKAQYSLDGITWQNNNEFTGLKENKEYTISAKYTGNHNYNESAPKSITVKTLKSDVQTKPEVKPVITPEVKPVHTPIVTEKPQKVIKKPAPVVSETPDIEETIKPEASVKPEVTPTMTPSVTEPPKTQDTASMNVWMVIIPVVGIALLGYLAFIISKKRKEKVD